MTRPPAASLTGKDVHDVPMSLQRIVSAASPGERFWIGPDDASSLSADEVSQYEIAHTIMRHLAVMAPLTHKSGHPGGPLSAFTACYWIKKISTIN